MFRPIQNPYSNPILEAWLAKNNINLSDDVRYYF